MPKPYITAADIIEQAHALDIHPLEQVLALADGYGWDDDHTVDALRAVARTYANQPQPQPHHAVALANQFADDLDADELDLPTTVASYLTTLDAYQQSGDPSEAEALEALEAHMTRLVGLDPDAARKYFGLTYDDDTIE
jgi:hypothetical protein